jgi:hypothetical protein
MTAVTGEDNVPGAKSKRHFCSDLTDYTLSLFTRER